MLKDTKFSVDKHPNIGVYLSSFIFLFRTSIHFALLCAVDGFPERISFYLIYMPIIPWSIDIKDYFLFQPLVIYILCAEDHKMNPKNHCPENHNPKGSPLLQQKEINQK